MREGGQQAVKVMGQTGGVSAHPHTSRVIRTLVSVLLVLIAMTTALALKLPAAQIAGVADAQKADYEDASGLPYFTELDSYYHVRLTQNFLDHGSLGDTVDEAGVPWDEHSYVPEGRSADYAPGIVAVGVFFAWLGDLIARIPTQQMLFWAGALFSLLAVIPAYLLAKRMSNAAGGVTAALLVTCGVYYFSHTIPGFFDTDMFVAIMPLLMALFFTESIRARKPVPRVVFALLFACATALYSYCWSVYIYFLIVFLIAGIAFIVALLLSWRRIRGRRPLAWLVRQPEFAAAATSIVSVMVLMTAIKGPSFLTGFLTMGSSAASLNVAGTGFPNVFVSVSEMQAATLVYGGVLGSLLTYIPGTGGIGIINGIGGAAVALAALSVLIVLFANALAGAFQKPGSRPRHALLRVGGLATCDGQPLRSRYAATYFLVFGFWVLICAYATTKGVRFVEHLAVPVGLLGGVFAGHAVQVLRDKVASKAPLMAVVVVAAALTGWAIAQVSVPAVLVCAELIVIVAVIILFGRRGKELSAGQHRACSALLAAVIPLALVSPTLSGAWLISTGSAPSVSDARTDAMEWIEQNTDDDAVVASWWDYGYYYELASDRGVLFDGGSSSGIRAVFVGRALTTDDAELSARILTMLATSGDEPVNRMVELLGSYSQGTEALFDILSLDASAARTALIDTYGLTSDEADQMVAMTHPQDARPVYLVLSSDMLLKASWWTYFATWDFSGDQETPLELSTVSQPMTLADGVIGNMTAYVDSSGVLKGSLFVQLFSDGGEGQNAFRKVYEMQDSACDVQVWRVDAL